MQHVLCTRFHEKARHSFCLHEIPLGQSWWKGGKNGKGVIKTVKECNAFINEFGKEMRKWFCGRHWNLAYDGCVHRKKEGSACISVPMMSCRGGCAYPMVQMKKRNYPSGCTHKALDNAGVCAKHGERRRAVRKSCSHEPKVRVCVSSMVQNDTLRPWGVHQPGYEWRSMKKSFDTSEDEQMELDLVYFTVDINYLVLFDNLLAKWHNVFERMIQDHRSLTGYIFFGMV